MSVAVPGVYTPGVAPVQMFNESLYAADFGVPINATSVPIDQLLLNAIAIWSAFYVAPLPAITFVPSYERLVPPQIGHISCDSAVTLCTIRVSDEYYKPDVVMLHEVGHAYLFGVYPVLDPDFKDDHWTTPNSLMNSKISANPTILRKTVELIGNGAATHLCDSSCHCHSFPHYAAAPQVCGHAPADAVYNPYYLLPLLGILLAGVVLIGIACSVSSDGYSTV